MRLTKATILSKCQVLNVFFESKLYCSKIEFTIRTQPDLTLFYLIFTCEVDLFEVLEIMAEMWHYIIVIRKNLLKSLKTTIINFFQTSIYCTFKHKYWTDS